MRHHPTTSTARRHSRLALAMAGFAFWVVACGGSGDKQVNEPQPDENEVAEPVADEPEDELFPPEKFDEIKRFLTRKNKFLTPCFSKAIEAKEVSARGNARVTVTMVITAEGRITKPKVTEMKPESQVLANCMFDMMKRWKLGELPRALDFSHTFGFDTL